MKNSQDVRQNIARVEMLREKLNNHCMNLRVDENAAQIIVYFPEGYRLGGVNCTKVDGIANAYERCIKAMDAMWNEDIPSWPALKTI